MRRPPDTVGYVDILGRPIWYSTKDLRTIVTSIRAWIPPELPVGCATRPLREWTTVKRCVVGGAITRYGWNGQNGAIVNFIGVATSSAKHARTTNGWLYANERRSHGNIFDLHSAVLSVLPYEIYTNCVGLPGINANTRLEQKKWNQTI